MFFWIAIFFIRMLEMLLLATSAIQNVKIVPWEYNIPIRFIQILKKEVCTVQVVLSLSEYSLAVKNELCLIIFV